MPLDDRDLNKRVEQLRIKAARSGIQHFALDGALERIARLELQYDRVSELCERYSPVIKRGENGVQINPMLKEQREILRALLEAYRAVGLQAARNPFSRGRGKS